jgi:hypothetical protein
MILAMKRRWTASLPLSLLLLTAVPAWAAPGVVPIGALTDSAVPDAVRKVLEPAGSRIVLDDGSIACELWLRSGLTDTGKTMAQDAVYPQLPESTLLGVISFPKGGSDYRGQAIAPGFYTLRYELLPNDGNHLGAAPQRDFVLLVPAASDPDPAVQFKFAALVDLSRKATGTKHPGPMSLVPAEGAGSPSVTKNDEDHWIFTTTLKLSSGQQLPFAMVVKGQAQQ